MATATRRAALSTRSWATPSTLLHPRQARFLTTTPPLSYPITPKNPTQNSPIPVEKVPIPAQVFVKPPPTLATRVSNKFFNGVMSLLPGSTEQYINAAAEKLRSAAPETTETYAAYGVGKELYLECAKQAAYLTAGKEAKGGIPKDGLIAGLEEEAAGQGLSEKAKFWYDECNRAQSFNSWASVTILHMWVLMTRFRAFPSESKAKIWKQHFVDHFFYDAEEMMHKQYKINSSSQRSKYLKDLFVQYRGMLAAYDEALARNSDAVLATAIWRNVFDGREDIDLKTLGLVTGYTRRLVSALDRLDDDVITRGKVTFGDPRREESILVKESKLMHE